MKMTKEGMGDEAMKKSLFYRAKKMPPSAQIMLLFAVEGVFLQYITSINGFGLNLYATNMGATDSQIGIIQMVPNIVACAALLPLGILADHLKSTKTIPLLTLLMRDRPSPAVFGIGFQRIVYDYTDFSPVVKRFFRFLPRFRRAPAHFSALGRKARKYVC